MNDVRRKGDLLYIPYPNAVFPNRCIKANQPIESADYVISFIVPPWLQKGYQDSHIKMVVLYKILHDSKLVKFKIGLSSASRKRRKCFLICSNLLSGIIGTVCSVGTFNVESEIFRTVCVTGAVVSLVLWMPLPFLGWLRLVRFSEDRLTDDALLQCEHLQGRWSVGSTSSQIDGDTLVAIVEVGTCEHLKPGWSLESVFDQYLAPKFRKCTPASLSTEPLWSVFS